VAAFVKANCTVQSSSHAEWITTRPKMDSYHIGQSFVPIQRAATNPAAMDQPSPALMATPAAAPRSPIIASTAAAAQAVTAAVNVHHA
jgi:hypothetical protein